MSLNYVQPFSFFFGGDPYKLKGIFSPKKMNMVYILLTHVHSKWQLSDPEQIKSPIFLELKLKKIDELNRSILTRSILTRPTR